MIDPTLILEQALFRGLTPEQAQRVAEHASLRSFEPGQYLFHEGEAAEVLHLVRFGRVALQLVVPGRGAQLLQTLRPGEVLGLSWMQAQPRWLFDARAQELTRTLTLHAPNLIQIMEQDPALGYTLMRRLALEMGSRLQAARLQLLDLYDEKR